jgi:ABC-2 type transport system ATP-binding protein
VPRDYSTRAQLPPEAHAATNLPPVTAGGKGPAVRVCGLSKRYGEKQALDRLDLRVEPGELRGLLGPNGAGKTTLLRVLFGLIRPDAGSLELLGRAPVGRGRSPLEGVGGFVEDPTFYPYLSGRANLELLAELDDADGAAIDDALERVGLATRARDRVGGYSTGMRQRLGIAAALLRSPRLLLLDEPTSGLDPQGTRAVSALLTELCAQGVAVILSSHLIGEVEAICDSYTIIRDGRVVWDGPATRLEADAPGSVYALSTSDDRRALALAGGWEGVEASVAAGAHGVRLTARPASLDGYAIALGREGIAVRRLELLASPLESLFFSLTATGPGAATQPEPADLQAAAA